MYSKDELLSKSIDELSDIAKEIGVEIDTKADLESVVYSILDQQAIAAGSQTSSAPKRKRTRIAKKDTDRVYTVNGKEGENFDLKKNKAVVEQTPLFKDDDDLKPAPVAEPAPVEEAPAPAPADPTTQA